ncbi:MAG TPA: hypothetical protein VL334_16945 [Anaerolineae bacterium]|nr:hypothetical protein [Anaerolineae bacterium]
MQNKQKTNWIIGAVLFGGFLLSLWLDLTGLALHQWLGVAVGMLAIYHLAAHWRWVVAVSQRFFGRTSRQARTFYVVDAGLAAGFAAIVVTGLVISTWLDLALASYTTWLTIHIVASLATLALVVVKIGLHWRWIVTTARKRILPAPARPAPADQAQPVAVTAQAGRRDFLRLMAGVGAVALLGGVNAIGSLSEGQAEASVAAQDTIPQATTPSTGTRRTRGGFPSGAAGSSSSTSSTCQVQCNRRCSYPGHCRRYTDSNGNGRCDLGECLS